MEELLLLLCLCLGLGIWLFALQEAAVNFVGDHELKLSNRSGRILARLQSISKVCTCLPAGLHGSPVTQLHWSQLKAGPVTF